MTELPLRRNRDFALLQVRASIVAQAQNGLGARPHAGTPGRARRQSRAHWSCFEQPTTLLPPVGRLFALHWRLPMIRFLVIEIVPRFSKY